MMHSRRRVGQQASGVGGLQIAGRAAAVALVLIAPAAAQSVICTAISQGYTAYTTCPGDNIVAGVQFASYGLPTAGATCGEYAIMPTCHSNISTQVVSRCVGRPTCALPATNDLFGNPCPWYAGSKRLAFAVRCEPPPPSMTPTPMSSPSTSPAPLVWSDAPGYNCYGGDLNSNCGPGTSADALGLSLLQCRAMCAADAACMGINFVNRTGACTKKCSPTYASMYLMASATVDDMCSFAIHPTRLAAGQIPFAPSASMTPSTTPSGSPAASPSNTRTASGSATTTATVSGTATASASGTTTRAVSPSMTSSAAASPSSLPWPNAITHFEPTTGADVRYWTVPATVSVIEVALWGAGGGTMAAPAFGGAGAFVTGMLRVTAGETLRIIAGRPGRGCSPATAAQQDANTTDAEAAGGGGGRGFDVTVGGMRLCASSGGGKSAIQRRVSVGGQDAWVDVAAAGGGGGGVYSYSAMQPRGGMASWNATGGRGSDLRPTTSGGDPSYAVGGGGASIQMGGEASAALVDASAAVGVSTGAAFGAADRGGHALLCPGCAYGNSSAMGLGYGSGGGGGAFGGGSGGKLGGGGGSSLISNLIDARGETAPAAVPYVAGGRWSRLFPLTAGAAPGSADMPGHVAIGAPSACDATGACYASVRRPDGRVISWYDARDACAALGPKWSLASIAAHTHAESILQKSCLGSIPGQSSAWIGLYDPSGKGSTDGSSAAWTWVSGASNAYFRSAYSLYWNRNGNEPNNAGAPGSPETHVHATRAGPAPFSSYALGLNDLLPTSTYDSILYGCCQYWVGAAAAAPSPSGSASPAQTVTPSSSIMPSPSGSGSVSPSVSGSPSNTRSGSPTRSPSVSPSSTVSRSVSASVSASPSASSTLSASPTSSSSSSVSPSSSVSVSPSATTSLSSSPSASVSISASPSPSASSSPSSSVSPTSSGSPSSTRSVSTSATPSATLTGTGSITATPSASASPPPPPESRCGTGVSVTYVTRSGTLLVTTPAAALNASTQSSVVTLHCSWIITAPVGHRVALSFLAFNAKPSIDWISVFDGGSASNTPIMYQVTSQGTGGLPPQPVLSSGRELYVWFLSTAYLASKGIVAQPVFVRDPIADVATVPRLAESALASNSYRCGPWATAGNINASGTVFISNPGLPVPAGSSSSASSGDMMGSPNLDCTVTVSAPAGMVVALSYLNASLARSLDFWSVYDGANAASPALTSMATGAQLALGGAGGDNATVLAPVLTSSGRYLYLRFQSVNWAPLDAAGRPRGVVAVITFIAPPRASAAAATPAPAAPTPVPLGPYACAAVGLKTKPWEYTSARNTAYRIGFWGGHTAPVTLNVTGLRGKQIMMGYQNPGSKAVVRDSSTNTVTLTHCTLNCSLPAWKMDPSSYGWVNYYPHRYVNEPCGLSGTCLFVHAFTDAAGELLAPPRFAMQTALTVPANAAFVTMGYPDINALDNDGSAGVCAYPVPPAASATPTPTASATMSPVARSTGAIIEITIRLSGIDGAACSSSSVCLLALQRALAALANVSFSGVRIVAAGAGTGPATARRALAASEHAEAAAAVHERVSLAYGIAQTQAAYGGVSAALAAMPGSAGAGVEGAHTARARVLQSLDGLNPASLPGLESFGYDPTRDASSSLLSSVSSEPPVGLWATVQIAVPIPGSDASSRRRMLQQQSSGSADVAAAAAVASIRDASASGALAFSFGSSLSAELDNLALAGNDVDAASQAVAAALTSGAASSAVLSTTVSSAPSQAPLVNPGATASAAATPPAASSGLSGGAVAGIIIGCLAAVGIVAGFVIVRKRSAAAAASAERYADPVGSPAKPAPGNGGGGNAGPGTRRSLSSSSLRGASFSAAAMSVYASATTRNTSDRAMPARAAASPAPAHAYVPSPIGHGGGDAAAAVSSASISVTAADGSTFMQNPGLMRPNAGGLRSASSRPPASTADAAPAPSSRGLSHQPSARPASRSPVRRTAPNASV